MSKSGRKHVHTNLGEHDLSRLGNIYALLVSFGAMDHIRRHVLRRHMGPKLCTSPPVTCEIRGQGSVFVPWCPWAGQMYICICIYTHIYIHIYICVAFCIYVWKISGNIVTEQTGGCFIQPTLTGKCQEANQQPPVSERAGKTKPGSRAAQ